MRMIFVSILALAVSGCSDDIDCEPTPGFYNLYKDGGRPSNAEAMKHMVCRDSEGNRI